MGRPAKFSPAEQVRIADLVQQHGQRPGAEAATLELGRQVDPATAQRYHRAHGGKSQAQQETPIPRPQAPQRTSASAAPAEDGPLKPLEVLADATRILQRAMQVETSPSVLGRLAGHFGKALEAYSKQVEREKPQREEERWKVVLYVPEKRPA